MMKKKLLCAAVLGLLAIATFAQNMESTPLLSVSFNPGLGNGKLHSTQLQNQHGLYNGGNLLLNYHISQTLSISAGLGILTFNANPIVNGKIAATEVDFLQIPIKVNYIGGSNAIKFKIGVTGFYYTHIATVTNMENNQTLKANYQGGNYGFSADIGPVFQISKRLVVSVRLEHQFTVSKIKNNEYDIENYLVKFGIQYAILNNKL